MLYVLVNSISLQLQQHSSLHILSIHACLIRIILIRLITFHLRFNHLVIDIIEFDYCVVSTVNLALLHRLLTHDMNAA